MSDIYVNRKVVADWSDKLRYSNGNFYINDKSTGSVVGQQPFGGARKSGRFNIAGPQDVVKYIHNAHAVRDAIVYLGDIIGYCLFPSL